jgi:hypothetical protein
MPTPFDEVIEKIKERGYHNQRLEEHSDIVGNGILSDLISSCGPLKKDFDENKVKSWLNVHAPGARGRKIDLLIGEPDPNGDPDLNNIRICIENKSVITAHRNSYARFDDLNETLQVIHRVKSEAVIVATVLVGLAERYLNVSDRIKPQYKGKEADFKNQILPLLSHGDPKLWEQFSVAVSSNRTNDPAKTIKKFKTLPVRNPGQTHQMGFDFLLVVPIFIDNVNEPYIARENPFGINIDSDYSNMLAIICKAYLARWHF